MDRIIADTECIYPTRRRSLLYGDGLRLCDSARRKNPVVSEGHRRQGRAGERRATS